MKKGFTLIELLAVLVVLAIIALITIPIVLGIINRARIKSEEASIRGYADTLEKAYSTWLIDNPNGIFGEFDYSQVDYKGNRVTCDDVDYNNGNIELDCCYVGNNENNYYSYKNNALKHYNVCPSKKTYNVADTFTLNGEGYHVIKNGSDYVVALKDNALSTEEVEKYGAGHINMYVRKTNSNYRQSINGRIAFYSRSNCGYNESDELVTTHCCVDYDNSDIKVIVDAWALDKFKNNELKDVDNKKARLLDESDLLALDYSLGDFYNYYPNNPDDMWSNYQWFFGKNAYWTMIVGHPCDKRYRWLPNSRVISSEYVGSAAFEIDNSYAVRPVINVYKNKINEE